MSARIGATITPPGWVRATHQYGNRVARLDLALDSPIMDPLVWGISVVAVVVLAGIGSAGVTTKRTERRIARIEHKVDLILDHLGLREDVPAMGQVAELARGGRKIEAIKVYREMTGAGLREAKEAVDRIS